MSDNNNEVPVPDNFRGLKGSSVARWLDSTAVEVAFLYREIGDERPNVGQESTINNVMSRIANLQAVLSKGLLKDRCPYVHGAVLHLKLPVWQRLWKKSVEFSGTQSVNFSDAMESLIRDWHPKITSYVEEVFCTREASGILVLRGVPSIPCDPHQLEVAQLYEDWKKIVKVFAPDLLEQPAVAGDDNSDTDSGASQEVKEEGTDDEESLKSLPPSDSTNAFSPTTASQQPSHTAATREIL